MNLLAIAFLEHKKILSASDAQELIELMSGIQPGRYPEAQAMVATKLLGPDEGMKFLAKKLAKK